MEFTESQIVLAFQIYYYIQQRIFKFPVAKSCEFFGDNGSIKNVNYPCKCMKKCHLQWILTFLAQEEKFTYPTGLVLICCIKLKLSNDDCVERELTDMEIKEIMGKDLSDAMIVDIKVPSLGSPQLNDIFIQSCRVVPDSLYIEKFSEAASAETKVFINQLMLKAFCILLLNEKDKDISLWLNIMLGNVDKILKSDELYNLIISICDALHMLVNSQETRNIFVNNDDIKNKVIGYIERIYSSCRYEKNLSDHYNNINL